MSELLNNLNNMCKKYKKNIKFKIIMTDITIKYNENIFGIVCENEDDLYNTLNDYYTMLQMWEGEFK